jgi:hypothetical protein
VSKYELVLSDGKGTLPIELPITCPICEKLVTAEDFEAGKSLTVGSLPLKTAAHISHFYDEAGKMTPEYMDSVNKLSLAIGRKEGWRPII